MKYAKIIKGVVDVISLEPKEGYVEAGDDVFGDYLYDPKTGFTPPPPPPPEPEQVPKSVSARQFKLQLEIQGLTPLVEGWVASQSKLIKIAYDNSGAFERDEPMLQKGFKDMGFGVAQLDAFYLAASKL